MQTVNTRRASLCNYCLLYNTGICVSQETQHSAKMWERVDYLKGRDFEQIIKIVRELNSLQCRELLPEDCFIKREDLVPVGWENKKGTSNHRM